MNEEAMRLSRPIFQELGAALIDTTPEDWESAELTIEPAESKPGMSALTCSVRSPDGKDDPVVPGEQVWSLVRRLQLLFEGGGTPFRRAVVTVRLGDDDKWRLATSFDY